MHGLGNDFVVVDAREAPFALTGAPGARHRRPAHGSRLRPADRASSRPTAPTPACASGTPTAARSRPAATPRAASRSSSARPPVIDTAGGRSRAPRRRRGATIDMGAAALRLGRDPAGRGDGHARACRSRWEALDSAGGGQCRQSARGVLRAPTSTRSISIALGPLIEHHPLFPERVNVGFAEVVSRTHIRLQGLGARRRPDARLRHGRLRQPRWPRCGAAWPSVDVTVTLPGGDARDRMARRRPHADDRPGAPRRSTARSTSRRSLERSRHLRLPPQHLRERGHSRRISRRQARRTPSSSTPAR